MGESQAQKLSLVRRGRRLNPVISMLPNDTIFGMPIEVEVMQEHPKSEELANVISGESGAGANFKNPSILFECLPNRQMLPP